MDSSNVIDVTEDLRGGLELARALRADARDQSLPDRFIDRQSRAVEATARMCEVTINAQSRTL